MNTCPHCGKSLKAADLPNQTKVHPLGRYTIADSLNAAERKEGFTYAVYTGEKRPPRRGEWYLSGAIVGAYRAHSDLSTEFHIATLRK